jgi:hypothetical protein
VPMARADGCDVFSSTSFQNIAKMANRHPDSAGWIGESPDLTVLISETSGDNNAPQEDGVVMKLHKSILSEYEYFRQRLSTQPEVTKHNL